MPVRLAAGSAHGGPLARVQHAEGDPGAVRQSAHGTTQGIQLAHQLALAQTADGRVATHLPHAVRPLGEQNDPWRRAGSAPPHAQGRQGRLDPRMPRPDHEDAPGVGSASAGAGPGMGVALLRFFFLVLHVGPG